MSQVEAAGPIVPAILCGRAGTRLWPASRRSRPGQFRRPAASGRVVTVGVVPAVESPVSEEKMRPMFADRDELIRENPEVGAYNQTI